jgi:hypothetical protein
MKPVYQTKFSLFYSDGKRLTYGNCLIACVASMMDLPIDEVPNVYTFYGLDSEEKIEDKLWFKTIDLWLERKFNKNLKYNNIGDITNQKYVIMRGLSMRSKPHTCIYENNDNQLVPFFDPHQTSEFLSRQDYFLTIE